MEARMRSGRGREAACIFIHIPKCAGTTLKQIIARQYRPSEVYSVDSADQWNSIDRFKNLPEESRSRLLCLKGHIPFGLHAYLSRPADYITMVRDPVQRLVSHYRYVLRRRKHHLHDLVIGAKMSLYDYVTSDLSRELCNGQARLLAGVAQRHSGDDSRGRDEDLLRRAQENIERHFAICGLQSRFHESVVLMARHFGWKRLYFMKSNAAPAPDTGTISDAVVEAIMERNQADVKLYEYLRIRFEGMAQENRAYLERGIRGLRIQNGLYGVTRRAVSTLSLRR